MQPKGKNYYKAAADPRLLKCNNRCQKTSELPLPTRKNNSQLQNYTGKMPCKSKDKSGLKIYKGSLLLTDPN